MLKFANIKFLFVNEFMDLVSRLKLFLNQNGISNSQFADTCGIPRPTLSQLLNGRNKKVSDEIIAKIHASYPSLSIMWLMFGDGDMFVPNANKEIAPKPQVDENSDFGDSDDSMLENGKSAQQAILFDDDHDDDFVDVQPAQKAAPLSASNVSKTLETLAKTVRQTERAGGNSGSAPRRVVSIMVFYSDNSFETFVPGK